jgi:hypothetical protein
MSTFFIFSSFHEFDFDLALPNYHFLFRPGIVPEIDLQDSGQTQLVDSKTLSTS